MSPARIVASASAYAPPAELSPAGWGEFSTIGGVLEICL